MTSPLRSMLLILVALSTITISLARSKPATPSSIDGALVTNTAFGFHGVSYRVPIGYLPFTPLPRSTATHDNAQWAWAMSSDYTKSRGRTTSENLAFTRSPRGITIALARVVGQIPPPKDAFAYREFVQDETRRFSFKEGTVVIREPRQLGRNYVGCIVRELPAHGRCNAVYLLPISPGGLLVLNAVGPIKDRAGLMADAEAFLNSFVLLPKPD